MTFKQRNLDAQPAPVPLVANAAAHLARVQLLLNAARLEVVSLRPTDHELRAAIRCDLDDLLKELRAAPSPAIVVHIRR